MNVTTIPKLRARLFFCLPLLVLAFIAGWLFWPHDFFQGYWFGLMCWTQLSVGALIVLLILQLTDGEWGVASAPLCRAVMAGIFILLPLFVPALFALPHIFHWTQIRAGLSSPELVRKMVWLNQPFFIVRTIFYLVVLAAFIAWWRRVPPPPPAGPILVLTIVLFSFFGADWMMSLQPTFYSSLYPFMYFSDAMIAIYAVLTGTIAWMQLRGLMSPRPGLLVALGKLLFASVLFWGYIAFAQFIIIWTGNLPDEAEWYTVRSNAAWTWLTVFVTVCYFAIPFCILLSLELKKDPRKLLAVCVGITVMRLIEVFWLMRPTPGEGCRITLFDFLMPALIGGCWLWYILGTREAATCLDIVNKEFHAKP